MSKRRFPEAWWTIEKDMFRCVTALASGGKEDAKVFFDLRLASALTTASGGD